MRIQSPALALFLAAAAPVSADDLPARVPGARTLLKEDAVALDDLPPRVPGKPTVLTEEGTGGGLIHWILPYPFGETIDAEYLAQNAESYDSIADHSCSELNLLMPFEVDGPSFVETPLSSCGSRRGLRRREEESPDFQALRRLQVSWGYRRSSKGNCYRYATGDPLPGTAGTDGVRKHNRAPGGAPGVRGKTPKDACKAMIKGAKDDGLTDPPCKKGDVKICIFVAPGKDGKFGDFHVYRQDPDGSWSHKAGFDPVEDRDASSNDITDPNTADRDYTPHGDLNYSEPCGCLCVPGGKIDWDTQPPTKAPSPTPAKPPSAQEPTQEPPPTDESKPIERPVQVPTYESSPSPPVDGSHETKEHSLFQYEGMP